MCHSKKNGIFSCGLGTQGYLGEIYIREDKDCAESSFIRVGTITAFSLNINCDLKDISTIGQLQIDNYYRNFEATFKTWNVEIESIYIEDDIGQERLRNAIDENARVWIKLIPRKLYTKAGLRKIKVGIGYITLVGIGNSLSSAVSQSIKIIGTGPLKHTTENSTTPIDCLNICCETLNESIYMFHGQSFQMPPAPHGSTGWQIEQTFKPIITGTGDMGLYTAIGSGAGLSGCPIHVVYRYLCDSSPFIPNIALTAPEQFAEIVDKTQSPEQQKIIELLQTLTQTNISDSFTSTDLWITFNLVFLPANTGFILNLSQFGLTDLHLIATLTNLTGLDVSFNNLSFADIETIDGLELVYLKADHNLLGQWASSLSAFVSTIKHLDISYNFITEQFLFSTIVTSGIKTLDFFDYSNNIISFLRNELLRCKKIYFRNNRYPKDAFYGNGFWESRLTSVSSSTLIAVTFPQLCADFTTLEELDISEVELVPSDDITALIARIALDKGVSVAVATTLVKYAPTYSEIVPVDIFNPLALPRNWLT